MLCLPCYTGPFIVWNEPNEAALLKRWFEHMREVSCPHNCAISLGFQRRSFLSEAKDAVNQKPLSSLSTLQIYHLLAHLPCDDAMAMNSATLYVPTHDPAVMLSLHSPCQCCCCYTVSEDLQDDKGHPTSQSTTAVAGQ